MWVAVRMLSLFVARDDGAAAIEYALISALIAVALLVSVSATGQSLTVAYAAIHDALAGESSAPPNKGNGKGNNGLGKGNGGGGVKDGGAPAGSGGDSGGNGKGKGG
jgi:Flp pilus assembly pilin Flp